MTMTVLEGDVLVERGADGAVRILQAPEKTRISLELLAGADPVVFQVSGRLITLAGQVVYRVVGWDGHSQALIAELEADRRAWDFPTRPAARTIGQL